MAFSYALALCGAWGASGRFHCAVVALASLGGTVIGTLLAGIATSLVLGRPPLAGL